MHIYLFIYYKTKKEKKMNEKNNLIKIDPNCTVEKIRDLNTSEICSIKNDVSILKRMFIKI